MFKLFGHIVILTVIMFILSCASKESLIVEKTVTQASQETLESESTDKEIQSETQTEADTQVDDVNEVSEEPEVEVNHESETVESHKDVNLELSIMSGDSQTGYVNYPLENPMVVKVLDNDDNPVPDIKVKFRVDPSYGNLLIFNDITNEGGEASIKLQLGHTEGQYKVFAEIDGDEVVFNATAQKPAVSAATNEQNIPVTIKFNQYQVTPKFNDSYSLWTTEVTYSGTITINGEIEGKLGITSHPPNIQVSEPEKRGYDGWKHLKRDQVLDFALAFTIIGKYDDVYESDCWGWFFIRSFPLNPSEGD